MRFLHVGLLVAAVVAACGGKMDDSCFGYVDAMTAHAKRCGESYTENDQSRAVWSSICANASSAPGASGFENALDQCAQTIAHDDRCDLSLVDCVIRGSLADGAPCAIGAQCAGGMCAPSNATASPNSELQCGTCASYVPAGGACDGTHFCEPTSTSCIFTDENGDGICKPFAKEGEDCSGPDGGACGPALKCSDEGTCTKPPGKGEACSQLDACAEPYRCIEGACSDGLGQGGACPHGWECAANFGCNQSTHVCEAMDTAPLGGPCDAFVGCAGGATCSVDHVCVATKSIGDACTVGKYECAPFVALCVEGTCQAPSYATCK